MILGGRALETVFKPIDAKRLAQTVAVMTADGSLGERGGVLDALPDAAARASAEVVYAIAPAPILRAIAAFCRVHRLPAQVAIEERMGCGFGLCNTCVVPVARRDGSGYDNLRACVDGPVFDPSRILWDRWLGEPIPTPTVKPVPAIPHGGDEP